MKEGGMEGYFDEVRTFEAAQDEVLEAFNRCAQCGIHSFKQTPVRGKK